jgi:hypothetical protein
MQFKFTKSLLAGYIIGLVLLLILVTITYFHGKKIDKTIVNLANREIPSLIAASNLKRDFQAQTLELYELYATNDEEAYKTEYVKIKSSTLINASNLKALLDGDGFVASLDKSILLQEEKANRFVFIMRQPEVDWDSARESLADFSASANKIEHELDMLVVKVTTNTQKQVFASKSLSAELTYIGVLFICLLVICLIALIHYSPRKAT